MISASLLRTGMAFRYQDQSYMILLAEYHSGQGQMGGANHLRMRNLSSGALWEHSFRADLKLEELPSERRTFEFLYEDRDACVFMDPENYEQLEIPKSTVGDLARFLEAGARLPIDFVEGSPIGVVFPDAMDGRVEDTHPPTHGPDSNWKPAVLTNGIEVMVPPFVKNGDSIRVSLAELKYMDRVKPRT